MHWPLDPLADAFAKAAITFPSVVSDLLIFAPSLSRVPVAPVESARSEPARSTNEIFETRSDDRLAPVTVVVWINLSEKTACDLEDSAFIFVDATVRTALPSSILIVLVVHDEQAHTGFMLEFHKLIAQSRLFVCNDIQGKDAALYIIEIRVVKKKYHERNYVQAVDVV